MLKYFQHFHNSEVCSTFTLISALCCCTEVPPVLATPLPGRGLLQVLHVEDAGLLLGVPASRALSRLTEGSKVPGTGGVGSGGSRQLPQSPTKDFLHLLRTFTIGHSG